MGQKTARAKKVNLGGALYTYILIIIWYIWSFDSDHNVNYWGFLVVFVI